MTILNFSNPNLSTKNPRRPSVALLVCLSAAIASCITVTGCRDEANAKPLDASHTAEGPAEQLRQNDLPPTVASVAPASGVLADKDARLAAAKQGDKKAAVALYEDAHACLRGERAKAFIARKAMEPNSWANSPEKMKELSGAQLEAVEEQTRLAQDYSSKCAGSESTTQSAELYEIALLAANSGDTQAGMCYASGMLPKPTAWEQDAAKQAEYRQNAERFIRQGLQAGDWRAVSLAVQSSGGRAFGWLDSVIGKNPEMAYELTRLQRLGADAKSATGLDNQLEIRAKELSPSAVTAADRRAEATFRQSFAKSAPYRSDALACSI